MEGSIIAQHGYKFGRKASIWAGFTLLEMLVVISIISVLMAILVPVLGKARFKARVLVKMNNQGQIVGAVNCYAFDHDDKYPVSSSMTTRQQGYMGWQEPTMLTGYAGLSSQGRRSVGEHLRGYINDASVMFCPNAPKKYKYFDEAWAAGADWDNPDTEQAPDPLFGTYCFYWNYEGYLEEDGSRFIGPKGPAGGGSQSSVVVSDYFGYDHWRSRYSFGSCEPLQGGGVTEGTPESSAYWSRHDFGAMTDAGSLTVQLHAGYLDGHVGKYSSSDVVAMRVFINSVEDMWYPVGVGPGVFYLPRDGVE